MGQVTNTGHYYHLQQARAHLKLALGCLVRSNDIQAAKALREVIGLMEVQYAVK